MHPLQITHQILLASFSLPGIWNVSIKQWQILAFIPHTNVIFVSISTSQTKLFSHINHRLICILNIFILQSTHFKVHTIWCVQRVDQTPSFYAWELVEHLKHFRIIYKRQNKYTRCIYRNWLLVQPYNYFYYLILDFVSSSIT